MRPTILLKIALGLIIGGMSVSVHAINYPTIIGQAVAQSVEPYYTTGRIVFLSGGAAYQGSATVVGSRSALTCGHVLYSPDSGMSTNMRFRIAQSNETQRSTHQASRMYVFTGYVEKSDAKGDTSRAAFQRDLGGFTFRGTPNVPTYAAWSTSPEMLNGEYFVVSIGYGASLHGSFTGGTIMLKASPSQRGKFQATSQSWWENYSYNIEGGMSGGPTYARVGGQWLILGINVSGRFDEYGRGVASGYRVIDAKAGTFIGQHLSL